MNRFLFFSFLLLFIGQVQANHTQTNSAQIQISQTGPFSIPRTQTVELMDQETNRVYPIYIKLPRGYQRNKTKRYPVIYITDANYAFQVVSGATRFPMNTNKMQHAILVGISYSKGSRGDTSRIRDFTPAYAKSWKKLTGEGPQHLRFINEVVFKHIDKHFRTDTNNRTFVGNSLGGLFGAYILITKPDMFNNYVLGSPSLWFNNEVFFELINKTQIDKSALNAKVFVGIGERETTKLDGRYDMVEHAQLFVKRLNDWKLPNLKLKLLVIPEANHETAFPTTAIQGLYWLHKH